MQGERAQQQCVAGTRHAHYLAVRGANVSGRLPSESAEPVGTGDDPKRAVGLGAFVDVDPNREHFLEQLDGQVYEMASFLDGPGSEVQMIDAPFDRHREILVQSHEPVAAGMLVEKRALDRDGFGRKRSGDSGVSADVLDDRAAPRAFEEAAEVGGLVRGRVQFV